MLQPQEAAIGEEASQAVVSGKKKVKKAMVVPFAPDAPDAGLPTVGGQLRAMRFANKLKNYKDHPDVSEAVQHIKSRRPSVRAFCAFRARGRVAHCRHACPRSWR